MAEYLVFPQIAGFDKTRTASKPEVPPGTLAVTFDTTSLSTNMYRYAFSGNSVVAGYFAQLDNTYSISNLLTTTIAAQAPLAVCLPETAFAAPSGGIASGKTYGWVKTAGDIPVCQMTNVSTNGELYTTSTAGVPSGGDAAGILIEGLKNVGPASGAQQVAGHAYAAREMVISTDRKAITYTS